MRRRDFSCRMKEPVLAEIQVIYKYSSETLGQEKANLGFLSEIWVNNIYRYSSEFLHGGTCSHSQVAASV
jgi:hypothetical protein